MTARELGVGKEHAVAITTDLDGLTKNEMQAACDRVR